LPSLSRAISLRVVCAISGKPSRAQTSEPSDRREHRIVFGDRFGPIRCDEEQPFARRGGCERREQFEGRGIRPVDVFEQNDDAAPRGR
jgi:hypothetical protein